MVFCRVSILCIFQPFPVPAAVWWIRRRLKQPKMMDEKSMPPPPAPEDMEDEEMSHEDKVAIERAGMVNIFCQEIQ